MMRIRRWRRNSLVLILKLTFRKPEKTRTLIFPSSATSNETLSNFEGLSG